MTFDKSGCFTITDLDCIVNIFADFYENRLVPDCADECPQECDSTEYAITTTFSKFPAPSYYYTILQNDYLARKYFKMNGSQFSNAFLNNQPGSVPSIEQIESVMTGKLLMLNVFYDELMYTQMEESAKIGIVDLISSLGGTLVNIDY
jgi:hypothetical protein